MFGNLFRNLPPVTKNLLIINVLIFAVMALVPGIGAILDRWGALYYIEWPLFRAWQPVSYMFLHGGFTHLFFNMFALLMFGGIIEWTLGSKRFLLFYLSCGIGAAIIQEGVYAAMVSHYYTILGDESASYLMTHAYRAIAENHMDMRLFNILSEPAAQNLLALSATPTVGASGAIYGILLAFGMLYPNRELYIMFVPVPIKAKYMVIGYGVLELLLGVSGSADGVAHFAHLGGMIFGFLLLLYWKKRGDFRGWY